MPWPFSLLNSITSTVQIIKLFIVYIFFHIPLVLHFTLLFYAEVLVQVSLLPVCEE